MMNLSPTQEQVARLIAQGLTNKEIARTLNKSVLSIKSHTQEVFNKFGVRRRAAVAIIILSLGGCSAEYMREKPLVTDLHKYCLDNPKDSACQRDK